MSKQVKQEPENEQSVIDDLTVNEDDAADVTGGGKVSMQDFHFIMRNNSAAPKK